MSVHERAYVRVVDGCPCYIPLPVEHVSADQYRFLENDEFDPTDTAELLEFLPGDVVEVEERLFGGQADDPKPIAVRLIDSALSATERAYWTVLFSAVWPADPVVDLNSDAARNAIHRIASEVQQGEVFHYPAVKVWIARRPGL